MMAPITALTIAMTIGTSMFSITLSKLPDAANAKGNQRRPLNYDAISATLLPAVWLTQLLAIFN
jgi:hypothetical protein